MHHLSCSSIIMVRHIIQNNSPVLRRASIYSRHFFCCTVAGRKAIAVCKEAILSPFTSYLSLNKHSWGRQHKSRGRETCQNVSGRFKRKQWYIKQRCRFNYCPQSGTQWNTSLFSQKVWKLGNHFVFLKKIIEWDR